MRSEPIMPMAPAGSTSLSEIELLLRLCARSLTDLPPDAQINWTKLLEVARRHRVMPLLYANLKRVDAGDVPIEVLSALRTEVQSNAGRNLQLAGELRRLLSEFEEAQIPVLVFKGIVLASQVYGDISLRDAGDLDLLVQRDDIVRAADLLVRLGHVTGYPTASPREAQYLGALTGKRREEYLLGHCEHHLVYPPTQLNVDLHWALSLREFAVELGLEGMWRRAKPTQIAGRDVPTFSPEDQLIVLCVNGGKDAWGRIDRICDVAQLLRRFEALDWPLVFDEARASGIGRMLRAGLLLASELLGAPLPTVARQFARSDTGAVRLVSGIRQRLLKADCEPGLAPASRVAFDLRMRERFRDRLRYCLGHLRPGVGDWATVPLPRGLAFLHYLIRPFRLAGRYGLQRFRTRPQNVASYFPSPGIPGEGREGARESALLNPRPDPPPDYRGKK
jgi:hypothetical protein